MFHNDYHDFSRCNALLRTQHSYNDTTYDVTVVIALQALFENMLIELPFASFFLSKILSRHSGDVDIHHLESLDPQMYK